jgi:glycosyltransferase involved in cell wall biosynthesis
MASRPPRRRVLLVTNWVGWAGAETQLNYLALGLSEAGHSVTLLGICEITSDVGALEEAGVEVVALGAVNPLAKIASVPRIARYARRAELVHCTGWDATLWGRLAALLARRPVAITEHTPGRELQVNAKGASRARAIALHNRLLDRFTYATVAVGAWQKGLLESEGVRAESIVRIPNAVPIEELRRRAQGGPSRADLGIPQGAPVVLQVARFAAQKGQMTALRAVARLRERLGDVRLLFVGEGRTEAEVKREAERLGAEWARFMGFRDDVAGLLALADLVVLPSTGEGLPMSLIEAIAIGTPVVATDVGDVRWLLESTGGGICISLGDEGAFVEACGRLLGDEEMHTRTSRAGERAAGEFDASKMVRRYEEVFEAAIESTPLAGLDP